MTMDHIQYKKSPQDEPINLGESKEIELEQSTDGLMQTLDQQEQTALMNKVTLRIVPFLSFLYVLSYLDRASLSNVHKSLIVDLHMEEEQYANAVGIFFLGYILLGVPSNIALVLVKARVWLSGIMVAWGTMCVLMMFAKSGGQLMAVRFFLGCAEAGFVPGVFLYLTYWFLPHERARQLAMFISSNAMAGLLGGLISYGVKQHLDGAWNLHWWQFLFFIEGISTVVCTRKTYLNLAKFYKVFGFLTFFILPDSPASAKWLTERERKFLVERYRTNNTESHSISLSLSRQQWFTMLKTTLSDKYLWAFSIADFSNNGIMITITFFLPAIIQKELGATELLSNLLSSLPYGCALVFMMLNAIHSDKKNERPNHILIPCYIGLVFGIALALYMQFSKEGNIYLQMTFICIVVSCVWSVKGPFLAWMTYGLRGNNAIGIGIVNSMANVSGWIGPAIQAAAYEKSHGYVLGFTWLGGLLIVMIVTIYLVLYWEKKTPAGTVPQQKMPETDQGLLHKLLKTTRLQTNQ
eukprot:Phypoly_transcript_02040.p1 GENE.Phypoly_transcript_02040~~Phypoly_transcript_02040.p1  ORF type:complete len:551 (-),score=32.41 Phypoly_transcript_02040:1352-2920(-)